MNASSDSEEFKYLDRQTFDQILESENPDAEIANFIGGLMETTQKNMRKDLDEAKENLRKQKRQKEPLEPFDMSILIPAPNALIKENKPEPAPKINGKTTESVHIKQSKFDTTINTVKPKKHQISVRAQDTVEKKEPEKFRRVIKPKQEKQNIKAKPMQAQTKPEPKPEPKLKQKKVDVQSIEERFKQRQQKIQDIFNQNNKGNLS